MELHLLDPLSPLWQRDRAHDGVQFRSDRVRGGVDRRDAVLMRESLRGGVGGSRRVRGGGCVPAMVASDLRVGGASWEREDEISGSGCGRDSSEVAEIAVLDMGAYFSQETGAREGFVENLRDQCHRVGLFYVRDHGVSQELCDMMLATAGQFFDLPASVKALALSLGLGHDFFDSTFLHSPHYQMKVARYPPKPVEDGNAGIGVFGVGPHSDTGFLSLLLQDDVGGLQAQTVEGLWIDVPPVEGTLVVNLGEMLELTTHGYYLATVHRVLSLPGTRSRYSVPFFFNPCLDAEAKPIDIETIKSKEWRDTSARGGQSTHGGENKLHPVFGINTFKSFARSHPQVVRRHHPDLMDAQGRLSNFRVSNLGRKAYGQEA